MSERGASPIKIAEYLAAGLPVVMRDCIGDLSCLVKQKKVGLIVETFSREAYQDVADDLIRLWMNDALTKRCRQTAEDYFSLKAVGIPKYAEVYNRILPDFT
jgi:glycosyltransferase involved in cell wall biosynthesis